jgi:hypothetical protein
MHSTGDVPALPFFPTINQDPGLAPLLQVLPAVRVRQGPRRHRERIRRDEVRADWLLDIHNVYVYFCGWRIRQEIWERGIFHRPEISWSHTLCSRKEGDGWPLFRPGSGIAGLVFNEHVGHLSAQHKQFLAHWFHLIALEGKGSLKYQKEIWCMDAYDREKQGRCLSHMVVKGGSANDKVYVFARNHSHPALAAQVCKC